MDIEQQSDGSWSASGPGYDIPIVVDCETEGECLDAYSELYGQQYWNAQSLTHLSTTGDA